MLQPRHPFSSHHFRVDDRRHPPDRLRQVVVDHEVVGRIENGGGAWAQTFKITTAHIDRSLVEQGVLSEDQVAERQRALDDPTFQFLGYLNVAVWGLQAR